MKPQETNLSGAEMLGRLRKGHMVRRACWVDDAYIRITNEQGYDEDGNAVFDERRSSLYTICTDGYFLHLGYSGQPFREPRVYNSRPYGWQVDGRSANGVGMLFADDWEDYGWISGKDFNVLRRELRVKVYTNCKAAEKRAIERAKHGQTGQD